MQEKKNTIIEIIKDLFKRINYAKYKKDKKKLANQQKEINEIKIKFNETAIRFANQIEVSKLIHSSKERETLYKELSDKTQSINDKLNESLKNATSLDSKKNIMAECQLELFKFNCSNSSLFVKHSLMIINNLNFVLEDIGFVLKVSSYVSLEKKLFAINEIRNLVLTSENKAIQLLESEKLGLTKDNSKTIAQTIKDTIPEDFYSNSEVLMFTPMIADPVFVAKTHLPMYNRILKFLDSEADLIIIELKTGKNLYNQSLMDKKENNDPIAPELIKLNYGTNNDKIIQLLHSELNGTFIENIDYRDFERHFKENGREFRKMQWLGTEREIVFFFRELELKNDHKHILVANNFMNKNNMPFKNRQLSVISDKVPTQITSKSFIPLQKVLNNIK